MTKCHSIPWFADTTISISAGWPCRAIYDKGGYLIAKVAGNEKNTHAAHIVKCVNHHDELVTALKKNMVCNIINNTVALERMGYSYEQASAEVEETEPVKLARAILAKLEKE